MKVKYSAYAISCLENIADYISNKLLNPKAASKAIRTIKEKCDLLEDFPLLGKSLGEIDELFCNYRYLVVEKYIVIYKLKEDIVYIGLIVDSRREYKNLLKELSD